MKKLISIALLIALIGLSALTAFGCAPKAVQVKTGLGVVTTFSKSKDAAADADGLAQADIVYVAVLVGDDGVIDNCVIDTIQSKVNFNAEGVVTTDLSTTYPSKLALGDNYNMKVASGIGKEWYEQANALATYVKGKTLDQVKAIALDESGKLTDADLLTSVTITVSGYLKAIEKAVNNATHLGAKKGDVLTLNSVTSISKSKDATADAAGLGQGYATMGAVSLDSSKVITSVAFDAIQANVNFDNLGVVTSDIAGTAQTKQELGDNYNMKAASGIGKEWYEQANALAAAATGKKIADAAAMPLTAEGNLVDLTSSVTITATDYIEIFKMASK